MKPIQLSLSKSTRGNRLKPSHQTGAHPARLAQLDNPSSELRALKQMLRESEWTREKLAEMRVERSQLLARIILLEHNRHQGTGNAFDNSNIKQDYSAENIAFTNEGGPPVDQE